MGSHSSFLGSPFCLSLLLLLITNLFLASASDAKNNRAYNVRSERQSSELDISSNTDSSLLNEEVSNGLDEEEGEDDDNNGASDKKFDMLYHPSDHGIYAGRSLISTEDIIKNPYKLNEDEEEEDDVGEVVTNKIGARKKEKAHDTDNLDPLETIDFAEREWQLMFRSFDLAYDSMATSMLEQLGKETNLFDDIVSRLRPQCRRDIYYLRDSVKRHKLWALRMFDSNGKLPSGVTYGRFSAPGDFEECLSVRVNDHLYKDVAKNITEHYKFHGKYCLLDFRLPLPERPTNKLLSIHESVLNFNDTQIGKLYPDMIGRYSPYASVFYEIGYLHGFCLPNSCDVTELAKSMTKALEGTYLIVNNTIDCEERPPDQVEPLRASQILSITLFTLLFLNASIASLAHYLLNKKDAEQLRRKPGRKSSAGNNQRSRHRQTGQQQGKKSKEQEADEDSKPLGGGGNTSESLWNSIESSLLRNRFYSDCFSIQKNFERLSKPDPRGLTFVHYTRIVAMALTVITHTGALGTLQAITKPADAANSEQIFRDLIPQMLANAFTSIQIFFFMAGFMLVISTYPSIARDKGHISFLEYAIKRAIRLMPGIAATIGVNFIWPLLVDGPMLKYFTRIIMIPCETNWWHTLGFISNFDHVEKMCLRHSYFSASDYQLHIIAFPLLILLYKQPALALSLAALLTVSGFVAQIIMILTKTVLPFMMVDYIDKQAFFNVVHYTHHPVWNHMSAFFFGFIVGYAVVKQIRINISPKTITRLWYILVPAGIVSIFAPYFWNHYKRPIFKWQMVLYAIFDRLTLLTTCAWLSYASMVLARPSTKPSQQSRQAAQKQVENVPPNDSESALATQKPAITIATSDNKHTGPEAIDQLRPTNASLTNLPRQRSSPNLAYLQQQQQQIDPMNNLASPKRMGRAISSSNLATIVETSTGNNKPQFQGLTQGKQEAASQPDDKPAPVNAAPEQQRQRKRSQAPPVANMNTLCLILSRLTFQLYLFNMVVLWIDVTHSKYYWFFSYYFIVFKGAAVYICSALLATIFFVTLESPSLTLYIAWVKSRAVARAKMMAAREVVVSTTGGNTKQASVLNKLSGAGMIPIETIATNDGNHGDDNGVSTAKPTFSFIDLSSSPTNSESAVHLSGKNKKPVDCDLNQTRM